MVLSWFASKLSPIAVDIGTETIKLLQVEPREGQFRLVAAACESIPEEARAKPADREAFVSDALRKMLNEGFRGKQIVTCLPANAVALQHLRIAKMSDADLAKALPFEAAGKLPFDANRAVIRHTVAGEVFQNQEAKQEVIVMAAPRDAVERHLNLLSKQKLEVVGIHVEPNALIECFNHLFRRKGDENICTMFIDMGAGATHVVIAHGKNIVFAKHIPIGGDALNKQVADFFKVSLTQAGDMRIRASKQQQAQAVRMPQGVVGITSGSGAHPLGRNGGLATAQAGIDTETAVKVADAINDSIDTLMTELQLCQRYYESIFPGKFVDRAIFVGGESRHITTCQKISQRLNLPASLGDPLARLMKDGTTQTKVDLRQPQPGWAIAVGLSMGLAQSGPET
ncbi:MAG TPA: pilus assembly protein PilM [Phycisphaerae bacterium]|jgi:type IV pilus assembly protein PilM